MKGQFLRTFKAEEKPRGCSIAIAPSGGLGAGLRVWDTRTLALKYTLKGPGIGDDIIGCFKCIAISSYSEWVASFSHEANLGVVWEMINQGTPVRTFSVPSVAVLHFTPDCKYVIAADNDVLMWEMESKSKDPSRCYKGHRRTLVSLQVSHDGSEMITGDDCKAIKVWSLPGECVVMEIDDRTPGQLRALAVTQDWVWVVGADSEDVVRVWEKATGQLIHSILSPNLQTLMLSPDGKQIITLQANAFSFKIWELKNTMGFPLRTVDFDEEGTPEAMAISSTGNQIVVMTSNGSVGICDLLTAKFPLSKLSLPIAGGYLSQVGDKWIADVYMDASRVKVWDIPSDGIKPVPLFEARKPGIGCVAVTRDKKRFVIASSKQPSVKIYSVVQGAEPVVVEGLSSVITCITVDQRTDKIYLGCRDGSIGRWDSEKAATTLDLEYNHHKDEVRAVTVFNVCGDLVASGGEEGEVHVWSTSDPNTTRRRYSTEGPLTCIAISPDDRWLVADSSKHGVRIWDLQQNDDTTPLYSIEEPASYGYVNNLLISPDSKYLVCGYPGSARKPVVIMYAIQNGETVRVLPEYSRPLWFAEKGKRLELAAQSGHGWTAELVDISDLRTQPSPATTLFLLTEEMLLPELKKNIRQYPGLLLEAVLTPLGDTVKIPIIFYTLRFSKRFRGPQEEEDFAIKMLEESPAVSFIKDERNMSLLRFAIEKRNEKVIRAVLNAFLKCAQDSVGEQGRGKISSSNELHPLSNVDLNDFILLCQYYPRWAAYFFSHLPLFVLQTDLTEASFGEDRQHFIRGVNGLSWCDKSFWTVEGALKSDILRTVMPNISCIPQRARVALSDVIKRVRMRFLRLKGVNVHDVNTRKKIKASRRKIYSASDQPIESDHHTIMSGHDAGAEKSQDRKSSGGISRTRGALGGDAEGTAVKSVLVPIHHAVALLPSDDSTANRPPSLLEAMVVACDRIGSSDLFTGPVVGAMLNFKWSAYARAIYVRQLILYIVMLLLYTLLVVWGNGLMSSQNEGVLALGWVLHTMLVLLILHAIVKNSKSALLGIEDVKKYRMPWRVVDVIIYIIVLFIQAMLVQRGSNEREVRICAAIAAVYLWLRLIGFFRAFRQIGLIVRTLFEATREVYFFFFIILCVVFGFAVAFTCAYRDDPVAISYFNRLDYSLLSVFSYIFYGFDQEMLMSGTVPHLTVVLFVAFMTIMVVILLNLLLATVVNNYGRIQKRLNSQWRLEQARIILEMEMLIATEGAEQDRQLFPEWLILLEPMGADKVKQVDKFSEQLDELKSDIYRTHQDSVNRAVDLILRETVSHFDRRWNDRNQLVQGSLISMEKRLQQHLASLLEHEERENFRVLNARLDGLEARLERLATAQAGGGIPLSLASVPFDIPTPPFGTTQILTTDQRHDATSELRPTFLEEDSDGPRQL